ncbi:MAG: Crp/Fnr family transcriptional regulator [Spirochaetaceae bacterium]|jgi:CRP-like cAMP-binding protein|nr:Crp/Fnr family transcriptional regulator [Spirochaetaceae bacterium]
MVSVPQLSVVEYRKGMYLLVEGKNSNGIFFIVRDGRVELSKQMQFTEEKDISIMAPGDFVGIVPAMAGRSQFESAQAIVDTTLVAVHRSQFEGLIQSNPQIAIKIIQQFSRRIRFLNDALARYTSSTGKKRSDDAATLFQLGVYYQKLGKNQRCHYIFKRYAECYPDGPYAEKAISLEKNYRSHCALNYEVTDNPFKRNYKEGGLIFAEGEQGHELYIIKKGTVKIARILDGNEVILSILKEGDIFGEMAVIDDKPRSAIAVALEDVTVMAVLKENFASISETQPQIIFNITRMLSERIWFSYKQLSNATIKDPIGRIYNYLAITLEKSNIEQRAGMTYTFDFNAKELMKMVFIPENKCKDVFADIFRRNKLITELNGKLFVNDVDEIYKLGVFYKNKQDRESSGTTGLK